MRIDHINLSTDVDEFGKVRSASIWFENTNALGERISGQFAVQMLQYEAIQRGELTPRKIAEQKLTELLEVKPDQDATAAFVKLSEDFESLVATTGEMKEQAIQAATMSASTAVEEARSEAIQAAAQKVEALLPALRKLVRIDELQPEDIADLVGLYDPRTADEAVAVGDIRSYDGKLYKVVQAHTTQADWTPDATPALWTEIAPPTTDEGETIVPEWAQPTGGHNAYNIGDKVTFEDKVYESLIDANAYSPTAYPAGWKEVV